MPLDTSSNTRFVAPVLLGGALIWLYWKVFQKLAYDWGHDDNYSHGFLIAPLALYFLWERREQLSARMPHPSWLGAIGIAGSLFLLVAGTLGAELFLTRISLVTLLASIALFAWGWGHLRVLAFPLAFLLLMIPLPTIVFNQIAFPLQLLASRFGELTLQLFHIPVLREGNVIMLAHTTLEVAEACSGIRSLISLLTMAIVLGYFTDSRGWVRTAIALASIPVAIIANGVRVAGTGVAAQYVGPEAATGFFHTFSGWLLFVVALSLLFAIQRALVTAVPVHRPVVGAAA